MPGPVFLGANFGENGAGARVQRRNFKITQAENDPRRPEIVGSLPIEGIRADLAKALEDSQVVVVSGGTGSGKSTQIPQFLLDDWSSKATKGNWPMGHGPGSWPRPMGHGALWAP